MLQKTALHPEAAAEELLADWRMADPDNGTQEDDHPEEEHEKVLDRKELARGCGRTLDLRRR